MKEQVILFEFTGMKGFFRKRPESRMLAFGITLKDMFLIMQAMGVYQEKLIALVAGVDRTTDQNFVDEIIDGIKWNPRVEVLETIPCLTKIGPSNIVTSLKKPSKYVGPKIVFNVDSRLPDGYYFLNVKIKKKDYQPILTYKVGSDLGDMKADQKIVGTKFASLTKNKLGISSKII